MRVFVEIQPGCVKFKNPRVHSINKMSPLKTKWIICSVMADLYLSLNSTKNINIFSRQTQKNVKIKFRTVCWRIIVIALPFRGKRATHSTYVIILGQTLSLWWMKVIYRNMCLIGWKIILSVKTWCASAILDWIHLKCLCLPFFKCLESLVAFL